MLNPTWKKTSYSDQTLHFRKPLKKISEVCRPTRSPRQQWPPRRKKNGDLSIVFFSRVGLRTYQHFCRCHHNKFSHPSDLAAGICAHSLHPSNSKLSCIITVIRIQYWNTLYTNNEKMPYNLFVLCVVQIWAQHETVYITFSNDALRFVQPSQPEIKIPYLFMIIIHCKHLYKTNKLSSRKNNTHTH